MARRKGAGLSGLPRRAAAAAISLPLRLVAGEIGAAGAFDPRRLDHLAFDGDRDGRALHELAALVHDEILDSGRLTFLEGPVLAAQPHEAIPAAELRVAAIGNVLAALIAHRALDLEPGAQHVGVGQDELGGELAVVAGRCIRLMNRQHIGPTLATNTGRQARRSRTRSRWQLRW